MCLFPSDVGVRRQIRKFLCIQPTIPILEYKPQHLHAEHRKCDKEKATRLASTYLARHCPVVCSSCSLARVPAIACNQRTQSPRSGSIGFACVERRRQTGGGLIRTGSTSGPRNVPDQGRRPDCGSRRPPLLKRLRASSPMSRTKAIGAEEATFSACFA